MDQVTKKRTLLHMEIKKMENEPEKNLKKRLAQNRVLQGEDTSGWRHISIAGCTDVQKLMVYEK